MSEPSLGQPNEAQEIPAGSTLPKEKDYEEFEVGEHQVPWFLWVFFLLIVSWASVSWVKFVGY